MRLEELKNKRVGIWGLGVEGTAVLNKIKQLFPNKNIAIINDDNAKDVINNLDLIIRSPGVSIYKQEIIEAKKQGIQCITEKTFLFSESKHKNVITIGITGTKGKTTTSTFCAYLLKRLGYKVLLVGNMGVPSINFIDNLNDYDYIVVELSSYQIADLLEFPTIGVLLNLFPEHIHWHLNTSNYYKDKSYLLEGVKYKITNYDNINCIEYTKSYKDIIYFNKKDLIHYEDGFFYDGNKKIFSSKHMKLLGQHNYINLCSVLTVLKVLNIDLSKLKEEDLNNFEPLKHRLQIINHKNYTFVNDSISTIPEATIACYKTFKDKNIYGILGGFDRNQTYIELVKYITSNKNIKYLSLIGQTAEKIENELIKSNFLYFKKYNNFEECFFSLFEKAKNDKNAIIILSPASASYDMFKNFEERGDKFIELIKNI